MPARGSRWGWGSRSLRRLRISRFWHGL